tara:strand:- start:256 stop:819 length:564 start_codon:yes stop_codon:yes gene_type:complete
MTIATSTQLQELYVAYFGRPADPLGLEYWIGEGVSQSYFSSIMHAQPEFQHKYGSSSTENQINEIYKNLFNREADEEGLNYWTNQITNKVLKLAEIATHLIYNVKATGGNASDLAALDNRSTGANFFTAEVGMSIECLFAYQPKSIDPWINGPAFEYGKIFLDDFTIYKPLVDNWLESNVCDVLIAL